MEVDINGLVFIGEGRHGKVYLLEQQRCIKVYKKHSHLLKELSVLQLAQGFDCFPKIFECKDNYMVREYFEGPNLRDYIKSNGFNEQIANELLAILDSFIQLGFSRIDSRLVHIIVTEGERLKVIDPTRNMSKTAAFPVRMLAELAGLGYKDNFLDYTKTHRPDLFAKWQTAAAQKEKK